ncbi:hypothetical protein [Flavobacterium hercynium]|uniref:Uncharacterized protein n=1 Tax=Flavobacterium hercynium TaxID=387094 RepID=A0A226GTU3_9FLAO|nr:hypothetical protein [Flavobacterium hercynium]OXA85462.1 hypothetical protein B0A66_19500 [Flavobacterium hercynium]SMP16655.1 hypothetical protein SAMN06265346_10560 [Flavobacterium hercynium]
MKKLYIIIIITLTFNQLIVAQTGLGTPTPRGALDINRPTTNTFGLVLPTNSDTANMVNPQGGIIAEGTMMYDSQLKCARIFNGTTWSNCLVDAHPKSPIVLDCSTPGFVGTYKSSVALSGASLRVTITNNGLTTIGPLNFQNSDLTLTGVTGITVASVSPTSASFNPGQSQVITFNLTGTPVSDGVLTATLSKINLSCTNSVNVDKLVRLAFHGGHVTGSSSHSVFNSQLQNAANYGSTGTHRGNFGGFLFIDISSTLSGLSAAQLQSNYDIICIRENGMSSTNTNKIKAFVDGGGVVISLFDSQPIGNKIFTEFGGIGSTQTGGTSFTTNTNSINNGIFGDGTNTIIVGSGGNGCITSNQLPPNSTVLATGNIGPTVFITGNGGRVVFLYDDDIYRSSPISGTIIDTPQERFLHNVMSYALGKAGF